MHDSVDEIADSGGMGGGSWGICVFYAAGGEFMEALEFAARVGTVTGKARLENRKERQESQQRRRATRYQ